MIVPGIIFTILLAAAAPVDQGHEGRLGIACVECHRHLPFSRGDAALRDDIHRECEKCHRVHDNANRMQSHPLDVAPSMQVPPDMVLDSQGKIVCRTCHLFHGQYSDREGRKNYYLRRSRGEALCSSCHRTLPASRAR